MKKRLSAIVRLHEGCRRLVAERVEATGDVSLTLNTTGMPRRVKIFVHHCCSPLLLVNKNATVMLSVERRETSQNRP